MHGIERRPLRTLEILMIYNPLRNRPIILRGRRWRRTSIPHHPRYMLHLLLTRTLKALRRVTLYLLTRANERVGARQDDSIRYIFIRGRWGKCQSMSLLV